jgi:hypothetical protein
MKRGSLSPYDACLSIPISHLPLYAHLPLGMHANTCLSITTSHCACKHNASTQAQCKHTSRDNQAPTMPLPMHRDKNTSGSNEARQCASTQAHAHATRPIASLPLSLPLSITCRRLASVALSQLTLSLTSLSLSAASLSRMTGWQCACMQLHASLGH